MITLYVFKNWDEARSSRFGPSIRGWPDQIKKDMGGEIHRIVIGEGSGKKEVTVSAVQTNLSEDASIAKLVVEVFSKIVSKEPSTMK